MQLKAGSVFAGDFQVLRPLGAGGMGSVYLTLQLSTGRKRALKLLHPALVEDQRLRAHFVDEARIGSRLDSDHVVDVIAAGVDGSVPWLAMEYLEGETLKARLRREQRLPPGEVVEIFRQLGQALSLAHDAGIVHRDLKPANIFVADPRREGVPFTVKILDFGIAKLTQSVSGRAGHSAPVGSPAWMAPEQSHFHAARPQSDVWALGLIAYACLVGRSFWNNVSRQDAALADLFREVLAPAHPAASERAREHGVLLPPAFDAWFAGCVAARPEARFATARDAVARLCSVLAGVTDLCGTGAGVPSGPITLGADSDSQLPRASSRATEPAAPPVPALRSSLPAVPEPPTGGTYRPIVDETRASPPLPQPSAARGPWLVVGTGVAGLALLAVTAVGWALLSSSPLGAHTPGAAQRVAGQSRGDDVTPPTEGDEPAATPPSDRSAGTPLTPSPTAPSKTTIPPSSGTATPAAPTATAKPAIAPSLPPPVPQGGPPSAAERAGVNGLVTHCWLNNEGASQTQAITVTTTLTLNENRVAKRVHVASGDYPNLRRCIISRASTSSGFQNAKWTTATFVTSIPAR